VATNTLPANQFSINIAVTSPTLYWFLDAFGWEYFSDSQVDSAGWTYLATGQTLRFPDAMNSFLHAFNFTVGDNIWRNCTFFPPTQPESPVHFCVPDYDITTITAFTASPSLSIPTAPAFAFYILVVVLTVFLLPVELICTIRPGDIRAGGAAGRYTLPRPMLGHSLLRAYVIIPIAHLIAAACVTGAARYVLNYLRDTPELAGLVWDVSLGSAFLQLVWLGFLATALGTITSGLRWWLKQKWKGMMEWEGVLVRADTRRDGNRQRRAA